VGQRRQRPQTAFTGTIATGLSLVAIVVVGLMFAYGEGQPKKTLVFFLRVDVIPNHILISPHSRSQRFLRPKALSSFRALHCNLRPPNNQSSMPSADRLCPASLASGTRNTFVTRDLIAIVRHFVDRIYYLDS
jgi:hypothetical protein